MSITLGLGGGTGGLLALLPHSVGRGIDGLRYYGYPDDTDCCQTDLHHFQLVLYADNPKMGVSVETIEHPENPHAFVDE